TMAKLTDLLGVAVRREAERAELETLRQQQAKREQQDEITRVAAPVIDRVKLEAAGAVAAANRRADNAVAEARQQIANEQAQRAGDKDPRAKINSSVRDAFMGRGMDQAAATALVIAIVRGQIAHLTINY